MAINERKLWLNEQNAPRLLRTENLPPYSQEAEEATLGAVISNPESLYAVADFLDAEDFFFVRHAYIWRAIMRLSERREPVDLLTVNAELESLGKLDEVGGTAYIMQLVNNTPTSIHGEVYGRLVERAAIRRRILVVADDMKTLALDEEQSIDKIVDQIYQRLDTATEQVAPANSGIAEAAHDYFDEFRIAVQDGTPTGLPYGLKNVDEILGGRFKGEVTILAGGPGEGKTSLSTTIAVNDCKLGARTVMFPFEMRKDEMVRRLVSLETGIAEQRLKMRQLSKDEIPLFTQALKHIAKWPLNIVDDLIVTSPAAVERRLRRLVNEQGVDSVIIDGLWLMRYGGDEQYGKRERHEQFDYITMHLSDLAREFNVPILLVHQYNRDRKGRSDKRPVLTDMAGSAGVERNANVILGLYRVPQDDLDAAFGVTELHVLKNRSGFYGVANLEFDKNRSCYKDAEVKRVNLENL